MKTVVSLVLLAVGLLLLTWGYNAKESFNSEVSEFFRGRPTQEAMTLLITGAVLTVLGAAGLIMSVRGSKR